LEMTISSLKEQIAGNIISTTNYYSEFCSYYYH